MRITIIIDGVEREYQGDYEALHVKDWSSIVREQLDDVQDYKNNK